MGILITTDWTKGAKRDLLFHLLGAAHGRAGVHRFCISTPSCVSGPFVMFLSLSRRREGSACKRMQLPMNMDKQNAAEREPRCRRTIAENERLTWQKSDPRRQTAVFIRLSLPAHRFVGIPDEFQERELHHSQSR